MEMKVGRLNKAFEWREDASANCEEFTKDGEIMRLLSSKYADT